jgi:hypothetical protein
MITRGVKEWYLASLQDDDHSWRKIRTPGTITLRHEWSSSSKDARYLSFTPRVIIILWGRQVPFFCSTSDHHPVRTPGTRMMITRGVKEWYLASLQDDEYSWSKRMVPGVLTGWWSLVEERQVPLIYSTSNNHPVRTPGTILLLHEWSSSGVKE